MIYSWVHKNLHTDNFFFTVAVHLSEQKMNEIKVQTFSLNLRVLTWTHWRHTVLIYSKSYSEHVAHVTHVTRVLHRLPQHGLYTKAEKCEFHQSKILFLGYRIGPEGVAMEGGKVAAVTEWPGPTTMKQLRQFLGFANFYKRFIRGYSSVAAPLKDLSQGGEGLGGGTHQHYPALSDPFLYIP